MKASRNQPVDPYTAEHFVYALVDPRSYDVRYVGLTYDLGARITAHLGYARQPNPPISPALYAWLRELLENGHKPIVSILQIAGDFYKGGRLEQEWIRRLVADGCELLNRQYNATPTKILMTLRLPITTFEHLDSLAREDGISKTEWAATAICEAVQKRRQI